LLKYEGTMTLVGAPTSPRPLPQARQHSSDEVRAIRNQLPSAGEASNQKLTSSMQIYNPLPIPQMKMPFSF
jgi:hypothetical protein